MTGLICKLLIAKYPEFEVHKYTFFKYLLYWHEYDTNKRKIPKKWPCYWGRVITWKRLRYSLLSFPHATFSSDPLSYYTKALCSKCEKKKKKLSSLPSLLWSYLDYYVIGNFCHYNTQGFKENSWTWNEICNSGGNHIHIFCYKWPQYKL